MGKIIHIHVNDDDLNHTTAMAMIKFLHSNKLIAVFSEGSDYVIARWGTNKTTLKSLLKKAIQQPKQ